MIGFFKGNTDKEKLGNVLLALEKAEGVEIPFPLARRMSDIYKELSVLIGDMP